MTKPKTRKGLQEFYREDFYGFLEDVLQFDRGPQERPHRDFCDFIQYGKGDGSCRMSNIPGLFDGEQFIPRADSDTSHKLALLPRGSFKSSYLPVGYTLWRICNDPKLKVLIFSWNFDIMMARMVREIKSKLELNTVRFIYGDPDRGIYLDNSKLQGKGYTNKLWNSSQMQMWDLENDRPQAFSNMPSIQASGAEESCEGLHPDIIIVDDIVTRKNAQSPKLREKVKRIVNLLEPLLLAGGEMLLSGTRYNYDDLYGSLVDNIHFDAMVMSAYNEDGSLFFPAELTQSFLDSKLDQMGVYDFSCQYLNQPVSSENAKFEADWLNAASGYKFPDDCNSVAKKSFWDPSTGAKGGDDFAVVAGYCDDRGLVWTTTAARFHKKDIAAIDAGLTLCRDDNVTEIWIEVNSNQVYFVNLLKQILKTDKKWADYQPKIHAYYQNTADKNKEGRIMNLVPKLQNGTVRFRPEHKDLYYQLLHFPHGKDDLPDAFEALVRLLRPRKTKIKKTRDERIAEWQDKRERDFISFKPGSREQARLFSDVFGM